MFFSTRPGAGAVRWAGACFAGGCATSLGIGGTYTKPPSEIGKHCADEFHRTPKEIAAVQARFQMAARRRNKPPPTSPLAKQPPARSDTRRAKRQPQPNTRKNGRKPHTHSFMRRLPASRYPTVTRGALLANYQPTVTVAIVGAAVCSDELKPPTSSYANPYDSPLRLWSCQNFEYELDGDT